MAPTNEDPPAGQAGGSGNASTFRSVDARTISPKSARRQAQIHRSLDVNSAKRVRIEDELRRRDIRLRRQGQELVGPCPVCGEGDDRFSINLKKQVWNCRGCDKGGDIIAFVQHLDGVDFRQAVQTLVGAEPPLKDKERVKTRASKQKSGPEPKSKMILVETFIYEDEEHKPLYQVRRYEFQFPDGSYELKTDGKRRKTFPQYRADPDDHGHWIKGIEGVRRVPYKLPELIEDVAAGRPILIAEGERKVDLLRSWGFSATCSSEGAKKWTADHSAYLKGALVTILPDNDGPGQKHINAVAASLKGIAASVHVLDLPGLPAKGRCDRLAGGRSHSRATARAFGT